jgi:starvation-inducible DNA-binding protein
MTKITALKKPAQTEHAVAHALQKVLANTYGLYLVTHNYHWNVEGKKFVPLHALFEEQYVDLLLAVDLIAERIRALGVYALPFEGDNIIQLSRMLCNFLDEETEADLRAIRMVKNLATLTEDVIRSCQTAKEVARHSEDDETGSLMVERITALQKSLWMLESTLK